MGPRGPDCVLPLRTELLGCYSDQDFLAKLHCVRQAFEVGVLRGHQGRRGWGCGRQAGLLLGLLPHLAPLSRQTPVLLSIYCPVLGGGACQPGSSLPSHHS